MDMEAAPLYQLQGAHVSGLVGTALSIDGLTIRDRAVTAVVGPSGSGKSTLLRLLSGRAAPDGWTVAGRWLHRGQAIAMPSPKAEPLPNVAWVPQIRHAPAGEYGNARERAAAQSRMEAAFYCGAKVVLLDEPTRGLAADAREDLCLRLRRHAEVGAAVVVSHDLPFVLRVADEVCMLYDGEIVTQQPSTTFFERPQPELVRQFVRSGSCSLPPPVPELPRHFYWFEPGRVAGMGLPGLTRDLDDDLFSIAHAGVTLLVSLTRNAIPSTRLRPFGIAGRHLPIRDMDTPSRSDALALCYDLQRAVERGQVVAVHCRAGLGRTGTIVASLAVCGGMKADDAISKVRRLAPGSLQTEQQVAFVRELEASP